MINTLKASLGPRRPAGRRLIKPGEKPTRKWVRMPDGELLPMLSADEIAEGVRRRLADTARQ